MLNKLKKYKQIILDFTVNAVSFAIYIISQQLILMPIMGRVLPEQDFANFIIFISIFSIISNSLGSELGIVRQILENKNESEKYNRILRYLAVIVFTISVICITPLGYNPLTVVMLSIVVVLANFRLYAGSFFRMNKDFKKVMIQNVLYLIGLLIGIFFYIKSQLLWVAPMSAEFFALIYGFAKTDLNKIFIFKKNKIDKNILVSFRNYSIIEFMINMLTYFDKILIYPILGPLAVNTYYSTTTMSKIISLITNPIQGVALSWINKDDEKKKSSLLGICSKLCIPSIIIVSIICIPLTYLAEKIFYGQYLSNSLNIIIPISIGVGFSFATTLIKTILLKFVKSSRLLKIYLTYIITFIALALLMSKVFGLFGFAMANLLTKILLLVLFVILLKKVQNEKNKF